MNKKKILFISQYFYPENFKGNDLVFELVKRGYEIVVITGKPNYPNGKFFKNYNYFSKNLEYINGVKVYRLPLIPRGNGNSFYLVLNYVSFYISSWVFFNFYKLNFQYDLIITQQLSPLTSSFQSIWYKNKLNKPLITWVLDLWPESVISTTKIKKGFIISFLEKLTRKLYKSSNIILISSQSFYKSIKKRSIPSSKIIYFPNWADKIFESNLKFKKFPKLPSGFNVVFAGNFGEAQDFKNIIKSVKIIDNKYNINFVFVGSGRYENELKNLIKKFRLKNVFMYNQFPVDYMPSLYSQASAMLLSLKGNEFISNTVPAKLQTYLSCSKPILGMIDGEASKIIKDAKCGFVTNAGNFKSLALNIVKMKLLSSKKIETLGKNSLKYYKKNFSRTNAINKFLRMLKSLE